MDVKVSHSHHKVLSMGRVTAEVDRCVQCGICSYNCPSGVDIRQYVWENRPINTGQCLACGQCISRCPRGVLRFEILAIFEKEPL